MTAKLWGLVLSTALSQLACSAGSAETNVESEDVGEVAGRLVYTLNINAAHKIDFYEYDLGMTGTHETLPVGEQEALRLPDDQPRTLAELFKLVRPDAAVPEALELADARAIVAGKLTEERLALDPDFVTKLGEARESGEAEYGSEQSLGKLSEAAITCSRDRFADQWGAAWYIQNFGTGFSHGVRCPPAPRDLATFSDQGSITNAFQSSVRHPTKRILQWKQMEGDFTNPGSTQGFMVVPGASSGSVLWNHAVALRTVSIHTMNPISFIVPFEWLATGTSPCSHLHRTIVWCTGS